VRVALADGYLKNHETQRRKPYQLSLGDALPPDDGLLPTRSEVTARVARCS